MGGWVMTERRSTRRYDLSLPIIVRVPAERTLDSQQGKTRDISTRGLYFVVDQNLESGSQRSEEHTSELQSRLHLVCRLLLEKKKKKTKQHNINNKHRS